MQINTKWFGTVEIDAAKVITFEKGLIGFEDWQPVCNCI